MTWAQTLVSGSGELSYRLLVERWPFQWVTHSSMVDASATPPKRGGLSITGKLKCVTNLVTGEAEVSGFSATITDIGERATYALGRVPSATTWLTAELTSSATSMSVRSTAGFASSGTVWLDSEAMTYSGKTSTSFTGLTRGSLSTLAQKHFISTGAGLRYPEITDVPVTMAGCRAKLYVYGQNDSPTGSGTQVWSGIVTRHPVRKGAEWSLSVDPITSVLNRALSADLGEPLTPRGIYYPWNRPFVLQLRIAAAGTAIPGEAASSARVVFPASASDTAFFETQGTFLEFLNNKIATATSGWDTSVSAFPFGDSWALTCTTDASPTAVWVYVGVGGIDPIFDELPVTSAGVQVSTFGASQTYYWYPTADSLAGAGSVPRGYFGEVVGGSGFAALSATFPHRRMHLGGAASLGSLITSANISWKALGSYIEGNEAVSVTTISSGSRYIETTRGRIEDGGVGQTAHGFTAATLPELRVGRTYTTGGSIWTALNAIISAAPNELNAGAVPDLRSADFDSTSWDDLDETWQPRIVRQRVFRSFSDVSLGDVVREELKLAGYVLGVNTTGQLAIFRLRRPVATEAAAITLDSFIVDKSLPTWEPSGKGMVNTVLVRRGYDPLEDEHKGPTDVVRDVAAFGQSPRPTTFQVEPKSVPAAGPETHAEIVELSARVLGVLAYPYAMVQGDVSLRHWATVGGSVVAISSEHLPDPATGALGASNLAGLVVGREADMKGGRVTLTILVMLAKAAGYAPEALVVSQVNTSGNTWAITVSTDTFANSTEADDWWVATDKVRVWRWDSTTAGEVVGTVASVAANVVTVTFDAVWTPGSDTWVLGSQVSTAATTAQLAYVYLAGSDGRIDAATDLDAWRFA